jgi:hypothetical protein
MNGYIVAAMRCSLILLLPTVAYAISTQLAAHGGKANKTQINAKPSQHTVAHNKRTAGRSAHASHAMHGNHSAGSGGGGAHVQHVQTHHHSLPRRRSSAGASPTPTPTPATEAATPAPDLTATPTASPADYFTPAPRFPSIEPGF